MPRRPVGDAESDDRKNRRGPGEREARTLYDAKVWEYFEIDERELGRRTAGLARLRMAGRFEEAADVEGEALRRALSAA